VTLVKRTGGLLAAFAILLLLAGVLKSGSVGASPAYHWPIKPFDRQHPIRGAFGDPRTLDLNQPFGVTRPNDSGTYSFHRGVDIVGAPGTPVYPVVSGTVVMADHPAEEIEIASSNDRTFDYWHLRQNVKVGQEVVAEQTVLGWIQRPFDHVHLGEIDGRTEQNPLAPGHLEPYADHMTPHAVALYVDNGRSPKLTDGGRISPGDALAIEAVDQQAMPVPGPFAGLPQAPALVEWRLRSGQHWSVWHVAADFRRTVPPLASDFWDVYAAGTYQNSPVFDRRLYEGVPGRYLFRVDLDTSQLAPGRYELEARVADIRGNHSTSTWPLEIPAG
jgi:hypothetical protein